MSCVASRAYRDPGAPESRSKAPYGRPAARSDPGAELPQAKVRRHGRSTHFGSTVATQSPVVSSPTSREPEASRVNPALSDMPLVNQLGTHERHEKCWRPGMSDNGAPIDSRRAGRRKAEGRGVRAAQCIRVVRHGRLAADSSTMRLSRGAGLSLSAGGRPDSVFSASGGGRAALHG